RRTIDVDRPLSASRLSLHTSPTRRSSDLAALTHLITVSRARGWSEQGVRWPHRRRADSFSPIRWRGGGDRPHHRGRPAAAELGGDLRRKPVSCSTASGRADSLCYRLARAR